MSLYHPWKSTWTFNSLSLDSSFSFKKKIKIYNFPLSKEERGTQMFRLILLHPMKLAILSATEHTYFGINMTDLPNLWLGLIIQYFLVQFANLRLVQVEVVLVSHLIPLTFFLWSSFRRIHNNTLAPNPNDVRWNLISPIPIPVKGLFYHKQYHWEAKE